MNSGIAFFNKYIFDKDKYEIEKILSHSRVTPVEIYWLSEDECTLEGLPGLKKSGLLEKHRYEILNKKVFKKRIKET